LTSVIFAIIVFVLILIGLPITISFFASAIIAIIVSPTISLDIIPSLMFGSTSSFVLVAVPFFLLAGKIMEYGGHSLSIFKFANSIIGWMNGGLGHVNVLASMLFGAMSGSATADAAGLGQIEIPAMVKYNYPLSYSTAITAASSTLAVLIPPSIIMVFYAVTAGVSVSKALIAGFIPGVLIGLCLMLVNYFYSRKYNWGSKETFSFKNFHQNFFKAFFPMITPFIIIGGIASGFFTPTEASAIAVLYAFTLLLVQRKVTFKVIKDLLLDTASSVGAILIIVATASIISFILTIDRVPLLFTNFMLSFTSNKIIIMLMINLLLLIVGCFFESIVGIMLLFPILQPIVMSLNINPLHFGVIMIANLAIGMLTPPVGAVLYAVSTVGKVKIHHLTKSLVPFYIVLILTILVLTFVPEISLFLPKLIWN